MKKYADNARFPRACLLPAALNTFGSISGTSFELVKRLVALWFPLAARQRFAEEKAQLLECIGVELVKRQCAMTDRFIDTHLEFCTVVPLENQ